MVQGVPTQGEREGERLPVKQGEMGGGGGHGDTGREGVR